MSIGSFVVLEYRYRKDSVERVQSVARRSRLEFYAFFVFLSFVCVKFKYRDIELRYVLFYCVCSFKFKDREAASSRKECKCVAVTYKFLV